MGRRLADLVGLREGEGARTARLVGFLFLITLAIVLLKAAQRGIFLAAYPRAAIPDAFMLSAAFLAASAFLAAALAPRLGPIRLVQAILAAAVVLLPLGRALLLAGNREVALALYVLVEATSGLLLVQAWQVASEALDVRSAKRLLPLVGVGAGSAWVLGGFAVGQLTALVGAAGLLLVAPALLLGAAALAEAIGRRDVQRATAPVRATLLGGVGGAIRLVWISPLLRLVAAISVLDLLVEQVVDFQLFALAQERWADPERIATFMGQLYGVTGILTVVAPLLVSGRLLSRFGSTRCLMAAQAWVLVGAIVFLGLPSLAVLALTCGGDRVLKQSLSSPGRAQMQTHIPAAQRTQAGALIRGVLAPLFYLVGGAALTLVPPHGSVRWLSLAAIALTLTLLALTARRLRVAYLGALRRSMDRRRLTLDVASMPPLDREHCLALAAELGDPDERRVAFAVSLLSTGEPAIARPLLRLACAHPAAEVRAAAVLALAGFEHAEDLPVLYATLERATEDVVEQACLQGLAQLERGAVGDAVRLRADDRDPRVAALARASLARAEGVGLGSLTWAGGDPATPAARALLATEALVPDSRAGGFHALLVSAHDAERAAAAWAMGEVGPTHPGLRRAFAQLLDDPVPAVQHAAIRAAGRLGEPALIPRIVAALGERATAPAAFEALAALDDALVPAVDAALAGASELVIARTAAGLAPGRGPHGDALLLRLIDHADRVIRFRAARALATRRPTALAPAALARVRVAVRAELATGYAYWAFVAALEHAGPEPRARAFLDGELRLRIRQTERRVLALIALTADPAVIELVAARLHHPEARAVAHAVELLEHALEPTLAAWVVPFLEPRPLRLRLQAARDATLAPAPIADPLRALIDLGDPHLRQCAMLGYAARLAAEHPTIWKEDEPMLPLVERIYFLRNVPLFRELSAEDLRQVARIAGRVTWPAGHVVFRKGEAGDAMFIVARGQVEVRDGGHVLAALGQHEFFGELAVLDGEARSADAVCAEDTELLSLGRADLEELIERRPEIAREIIRVLTRRLRDTNLRAVA